MTKKSLGNLDIFLELSYADVAIEAYTVDISRVETVLGNTDVVPALSPTSVAFESGNL